MKSAVNVIYDMREDTQIQELARLREKAFNDMVNSLTLAKREGIDVGRQEIINKFLQHGMSQAEIDAILKDQP